MTPLLAALSLAARLTILGMVLVIPSRVEAASSTFASDREGWLVVDLAEPPTGHAPAVVATYTPNWNATGGNPAGHVSHADPSGNAYFFSAPAAFLGNRSDAYDRHLTFDMTEDRTGVANPLPSVVLVGQTITLYSGQFLPPTTAWTTFDVLLRGTSFTVDSPTGPAATDAQVLSVLSNLQALYLVGDWILGDDMASLDNVHLQLGQPTAVQPGTWGRPKALELRAAGANPGRGQCGVLLVLARRARVEAEVVDVQGRTVAVLARGEEYAAGPHPLTWEGRDAKGGAAAAGVYFVRARANGEVRGHKVVLAH